MPNVVKKFTIIESDQYFCWNTLWINIYIWLDFPDRSRPSIKRSAGIELILPNTLFTATFNESEYGRSNT